MRTTRQPARQIATFAAVGLCAGALSGCHEILRVALGGPDPPVHQPPPGPARMAADSGRAFTGKADGELASRIVIRHGFVKSTIKNARFIGDFTGKLKGSPAAGDEALGPLAAARWHGQFTGTRNRANGKITMSGTVLATFTDPTAGRACLRLRHKRASKRAKPRSTITVLGGEGGARTLAGSASVRVTIRPNGSLRLSGTVKMRRGAARGFTRACTKLARTFRLQPLPPA